MILTVLYYDSKEGIKIVSFCLKAGKIWVPLTKLLVPMRVSNFVFVE